MVRRTVHTVKVFVDAHGAELGALGGYVLKTVADAAVEWAKQHFRRNRSDIKPKKVIIYGPDNRPIRTVIVKDSETIDDK